MYSDMIIRQELERFKIDESYEVVQYDIEQFKKGVPELSEQEIKDVLGYAYGRSWYWRRLMQAINCPDDTLLDKVMGNLSQILSIYPNFIIAVILCFRRFDMKVEVLKPVTAVEATKPKKKVSRK